MMMLRERERDDDWLDSVREVLCYLCKTDDNEDYLKMMM